MARWKGQSHQGPVKITPYRDKYNAQDWADGMRNAGKSMEDVINCGGGKAGKNTKSDPARGEQTAPYPFGDDGVGDH